MPENDSAALMLQSVRCGSFSAVFLSLSSFSFLAKLVLLSPVEKSMLGLINRINHDVLTVIEGIHKEKEMKQEVP